jgi:hypothetical protein
VDQATLSEGAWRYEIDTMAYGSVDELERKLAQFPPKTVFLWQATGEMSPDMDARFVGELRAFASKHDLVLRVPGS